MFRFVKADIWSRFIAVSWVFACVALAPLARAVSPAPDGGYPGQNTAEGDDALFSLTSGIANNAIGFDALYNNTTGSFNTATGSVALYNNVSGDSNTATGADALYYNTTGFDNTATGLNALEFNTTGNDNTATGLAALFLNSSGVNNTATGSSALQQNTTGGANTATGVDALAANTTANLNTATGADALEFNTTGFNNTASGAEALNSNNTGNYNTATGESALYNNSAGSNNTATGASALHNVTGNGNTAVGFNAGINLTTGSNNIDINNSGVAGESGTTRIGTPGVQTGAFMAGIYGATVAKGIGVVVDSTGKLGTKGSSERFKTDIKPMDKASEALLGLKPVSFRYKKELDPEGIPQFGLVAEDVAKINPDLVVRDDKGDIYTVRYDAVNAMLLNEFLKQHRQMQELQATVAQQQKEIETLKIHLDPQP
jgi:trimeric autotransporter adhesin